MYTKFAIFSDPQLRSNCTRREFCCSHFCLFTITFKCDI